MYRFKEEFLNFVRGLVKFELALVIVSIFYDFFKFTNIFRQGDF